METPKYITWMDGQPETVGPEGYPLYANDPYYNLQQIISVYLSEIKQKNKTLFKSHINPEEYSTGNTLLNLPPHHQPRLLMAIFYRLYWLKENNIGDAKFAYFYITSSLFRRKQPFSAEDLTIILDLCAQCYAEDQASIKGLLRQVEWFVKDNGKNEAFVSPLNELKKPFLEAKTAEDRKMAERIDELLAQLV